jgi:hypothetical protein
MSPRKVEKIMLQKKYFACPVGTQKRTIEATAMRKRMTVRILK